MIYADLELTPEEAAAKAALSHGDRVTMAVDVSAREAGTEDTYWDLPKGTPGLVYHNPEEWYDVAVGVRDGVLVWIDPDQLTKEGR